MMGRTLNLNHSRAKILALLLVYFSLPVAAQQAGIEIILSAEPVNAFIDRPGDLYIQLKNDQIIKYSKEGKLIGEFKPKESPTIFEPRDGSRTFTHYRARNLAGFTGFGSEPKTPINEEFAIEPWLACSAGDQGMWILDKADYSLRRINLASLKTEAEFTLPAGLHGNVELLREYQGFLFLLINSQIHIFSGFGKQLKTIPGEEIRWFNFIGEELYYADKGRLNFYDLFDGTQRKEYTDSTALFILLTDEVRYAVYPGKMVISRIN
ncbi:MAG: hypothetical protein HRU69_08680 [Flammeovirgaceae bacterium]|nr:MAG: hypothetical protein HRU69_08680 [Flammeovirgaceae bacterium]